MADELSGAVGGLGAFLGGVRTGQVQERQLGLREQQEQRLSTFQSGQQDINLSRLQLQQEKFTFDKDRLRAEQNRQDAADRREFEARQQIFKGIAGRGVVKEFSTELVNPTTEGLVALDVLASEYGAKYGDGANLNAVREGNVTLLAASDPESGESIQMMPENVKAFDSESERDFLQGVGTLFAMGKISLEELGEQMRSFRGGPNQGQTALKVLKSGRTVVQDASGNIKIITPEGLPIEPELRVVGGSLVWIDPDTGEAQSFTPPPTAKQGEILMIKQPIGTGSFGFTEFGKVPFMVVGEKVVRMEVPGLDVQPTSTPPPPGGLTILQRIQAAVKGTKKK